MKSRGKKSVILAPGELSLRIVQQVLMRMTEQANLTVQDVPGTQSNATRATMIFIRLDVHDPRVNISSVGETAMMTILSCWPGSACDSKLCEQYDRHYQNISSVDPSRFSYSYSSAGIFEEGGASSLTTQDSQEFAIRMIRRGRP